MGMLLLAGGIAAGVIVVVIGIIAAGIWFSGEINDNFVHGRDE